MVSLFGWYSLYRNTTSQGLKRAFDRSVAINIILQLVICTNAAGFLQFGSLRHLPIPGIIDLDILTVKDIKEP